MSQRTIRVTLPIGLLLVALCFSLHAQTPAKSPDPALQSDAQEVTGDAKELDDFLTSLALDSLPVHYVEDKDWGMQSERWDGVKVSFENGRLRTKRRKKKVNHGTWERYGVSLVDPEKSFSVKLDNFQDVAKDKVTFDIAITADVDVDARQSKWVKGVQLYSISVKGFASIRLVLSIQLGSSMDISKFPPDLIFDPQISDADIQLSNFRIDRVSKAGGEFAQQLTRIAREKIEQKIAKKEEKLVNKLNKKIEEKRDRFTLSVHDAIKSKWATAAEKLLDESEEAEDQE